MTRLIDLTGKRFGRLVALKRNGTYVSPGGATSPTWLCRCDCGNATTVQGGPLRRGSTKSCGCLNRELMSAVGSANSKGDEIGYRAAHWRVYYAKGSASDQSCIDCGAQAREWSYIGGCPRERVSVAGPYRGRVFSPDPERYAPRCNSCHKLNDLRKEAA